MCGKFAHCANGGSGTGDQHHYGSNDHGSGGNHGSNNNEEHHGSNAATDYGSNNKHDGSNYGGDHRSNAATDYGSNMQHASGASSWKYPNSDTQSYGSSKEDDDVCAPLCAKCEMCAEPCGNDIDSASCRGCANVNNCMSCLECHKKYDDNSGGMGRSYISGGTGSYGSMGRSYPSGGSGGSGSYGDNGGGRPRDNTPAELIANLRTMLDSLSTDAATKGALHEKLVELEKASASCSNAKNSGVVTSGPMQPLTCSGSGGESKVTFVPFEQAFGAGLSNRIADAKAKGNRVCFCR
jgi:hypothetical protein